MSDNKPARSPSEQRSQMAVRLAGNAATKPVNVAVPAAVAVAALMLGQPWLLAIAALVYVVLSVLTFFDAGEAERVGRASRAPAGQARTPIAAGALSPRVRRWMSEAYQEEERIRQAMGESDASFASLSSEVDGLVRALETIARRAQKIDDYLAAQDRSRVERRLAEVQARPDDPACRQLADALGGQLQTMDRMGALFDRFEAEMENVVTTLRVMRGQLIQMSVAQAEYGEERLADQARALREQVGAAAESMEEVTSAAD